MKTKILPFRKLLESTPDAMVIVNRAGEIVLINSQTEKLFGYDREELLGHSVERLIPARFQDRHLDHRPAYFSDPRVRALGVGPELYAIRKDGQEFRCECVGDRPRVAEISSMSEISPAMRRVAECAK